MMMTTDFVSRQLGERYSLVHHPSGLDIYVYPKDMMGTYALFATRYGSVDHRFRLEGDAEVTEVPDGIAHFLEHKMFENEDGSDSFARFSALGADANAYTGYDRTAYLFNCTDHFREALTELLTFVTHPYFTPETVQKEQGIIAEEIRMYEDNPWERCFRNLLCGIYRNHPVRNNICGSESSIGRITADLLYRCYHVFYDLSNMTLVVCGNVSAEEVAEIADRVLPAGKRHPRIIREAEEEPERVYKPQITARMQTAKPIFNIGVKDTVIAGLPQKEKLRRDAALTLLCDILFSRSGRFYNDLFEEGVITPTFAASYSSMDTCGFLCVAGESDDPEGVLERMKRYVAHLSATGIPAEEFELRRRVMYADEIRAYDSTEEIANRLLSFVFDGADMFSYPALIGTLQKEELDELLRTFFHPERMTLSVIMPLQ